MVCPRCSSKMRIIAVIIEEMYSFYFESRRAQPGNRLVSTFNRKAADAAEIERTMICVSPVEFHGVKGSVW